MKKNSKQYINKKLQEALVNSSVFSKDCPSWLRYAATSLRKEMKKLGLIIKVANEKAD